MHKKPFSRSVCTSSGFRQLALVEVLTRSVGFGCTSAVHLLNLDTLVQARRLVKKNHKTT